MCDEIIVVDSIAQVYDYTFRKPPTKLYETSISFAWNLITGNALVTVKFHVLLISNVLFTGPQCKLVLYHVTNFAILYK